ncbi:MAG: tetratricopeptide repeat protein [Nitrospirae bacterium]|nr:tetratricopeptide repeat protein [Nitrospirota bacterium]
MDAGDDKTLDKLLLYLEDADTGFSTVEVNEPRRQAEIVEFIKTNLTSKKTITVDLNGLSSDTTHIAEVRRRANDAPDADVILVLNMHTLAGSGEKDQVGFVRGLNFSRELYSGIDRLIVFFFPSYFVDLVLKHAGDFYDFSPVNFKFLSVEKSAFEWMEPGRDTEDEVSLRNRAAFLETVLDSYSLSDRERADKLYELAGLYKKLYMFDAAREKFGVCLELVRKLWDKKVESQVLNDVGALCLELGEYVAALGYFEESLHLAESEYGPEHPEVAVRLNNLAQLLKATNRLAEAEPLMRRALNIDEDSFGKNHPKVAIRYNNLAQLLQDTNRFVEAEPLMRKALEIDEASFGSNHPNVAIRLNNLASLLQTTNRLTEAEPLKRRALEIDEDSLGPNHPNVAVRLNNLAQLLKATNRPSEAEPLMRQVVDIFEKTYGVGHPKVATALNNLATLYHDTNRLSEAEPLMRRALMIDENSYGKDHPDVAIKLSNLAGLLYSTNRLSEAEPLMRRAVEILLKFTRATGHPHTSLQLLVSNYGGLLMKMGKSREQVRAALQEIAPELF